jgi:predicted transposase YdaD
MHLRLSANHSPSSLKATKYLREVEEGGRKEGEGGGRREGGRRKEGGRSRLVPV